MNAFDQLLAQLAAAMRSERQPAALMEVAAVAQSAFERAFGTSNRRTRAMARLTLRLEKQADRRKRVDTVYRIAELLAATSNDYNRSIGRAVQTRGVDFHDSLPQEEEADGAI